jgi:hypothetical protein
MGSERPGLSPVAAPPSYVDIYGQATSPPPLPLTFGPTSYDYHAGGPDAALARQNAARHAPELLVSRSSVAVCVYWRAVAYYMLLPLPSTGPCSPCNQFTGKRDKEGVSQQYLYASTRLESD